MAKKKMTQFAVIGIGRFGAALTKRLYASGAADVLALDASEARLKTVDGNATHIMCADATDENVLKELGIMNFDAVIVSIGGDLEASIFVTLLCKQMGAPYVIAKAVNAQHKHVLEKIGADTVIFPEEYMGEKLAERLTQPNMFEIMELASDYRLIEIRTPEKWQHKKLKDLDVRNKFGVNILLIKRGEAVESSLTGDSELLPDDTLIIGGGIEKTEKLKTKATENLGGIENFFDIK